MKNLFEKFVKNIDNQYRTLVSQFNKTEKMNQYHRDSLILELLKQKS